MRHANAQENRLFPVRSPHHAAGAEIGAGQAQSAQPVEQSGDVRDCGRGGPVDPAVRARRGSRGRYRFGRRPDRRLAVVHGLFRQLRRGACRGPRQGARRHAARHADRNPRQEAGVAGRRRNRNRVEPRPQAGRSRPGRGRRHRADRRRGDRRHRLGRRIRDHRRIRPGDPRIRRRSFGGHRRHPRRLRLAQDARHREARRELPRPHDRHGRRRRAPEDAERDRAQHPAGRHDDHLPARRGDARTLRHLCRRGRAGGLPRGPARDADPDHDRRAAVGDRHRRHGPAGEGQRHRQIRPRRRSGGRCRHAAARQDRHDHLRQPHGRRLRAAARRQRARTGRRRPHCLAADETPEGKSIVELARKMLGRGDDASAEIAETIAFSAQTRMSGADLQSGSSIRKGATDAMLRMVQHAGDAAARSRASSASPAPAARRWWSRATVRCWASSI